MTLTTDEVRVLVRQLEECTFVRVSLDDTPHRCYPTTLTAEAAAALRQWIAERERADALEMICKDANEAAMKHWPCNNPDRGDV